MTDPRPRKTAGSRGRLGRRGGPAAAGGFSFQASVTAIALAALAAGRRLNWFPGIDDAPQSVWAETGGPGDDIRLILRDGSTAEAQVKKGLKADAKLFEALFSLARGVEDRLIDRGLLVVCPQSRPAIARDLREDLVRIGQGRTDGLSRLGAAFLEALQAKGLSPATCGRLHIQTLHALAGDEADIRVAQAHLAAVLEAPEQAQTAWNALAADASRMIVERGGGQLAGVVRLLDAAGVSIADDPGAGAAALAKALRVWTLAANADLQIVGLARPLPLRDGWIPIKAVVHDEADPPAGLHEAVARYHSWSSLHRPSGKHLEPLTLGRFFTRAVVVAGPGMGKSTLLRRLALVYADAGRPVLRAPLRTVAARMSERGEGFAEAAFAVGLAEFGHPPDQVRRGLADWVLLCDGLDECGKMQGAVAEGLRDFALAHPRATVIATTRPIGYRRSILASWRHYGLFPGDDGEIAGKLDRLLQLVLGDGDALQAARARADGVAKGKLKAVIARSPLLLSLAVSLLARGAELGDSEPGLYERIIRLIEAEPAPRAPPIAPSPAVLSRFLELLAVSRLDIPLAARAETLDDCARRFQSETDWPILRARDAAEACAAHWEAVGLIERVWYDDADALTFVHNTFGEFLAARALQALEPAVRALRLAEKVREPAWSAALDFVAPLGGAPALVEAHLAIAERQGDPRHLQKALRLAGEYGVSAEVRRRLVNLAVGTLASEDARAARRTADALYGWCGPQTLDVAAAVQPLLSHPQPWTRLSAWALAVRGGEACHDLAGLKAVLKDIPKDGFAVGTPLQGGLDLADLGVSRVVEGLVLAGTRILLERCEATEADALLAPLLREIIGLGRMNFRWQLRDLLKAFGRDYELRDPNEGLTRPWFSPEYDAASVCAYRRFLSALIAGARPEPTWTQPLEEAFELAGFLDAVGFDERPASDVWDWREEQAPESLAACVQLAAQATGLPIAVLRAQAEAFLASLEAGEPLWATATALPDVDHPPIEWRAVGGLAVDPLALEPTLYHRSDFAVKLAALQIDALAGPALKREIGVRALANGRWFALAAGAYLVQGEGEAATATLIHERLSQPLCKGCEYLFRILATLEHRFDAAAEASLAAGLSSDDLEIARAAAQLAQHHAERPDGGAVLPLLKTAYAHWLVHEPEEPETGRREVSPRDALLKAWWRLEPPDLDAALACVADVRREIREMAGDQLREMARASPAAAARLVEAMARGAPGGALVPALLREGVALEGDSVERLRRLLKSASAEDRYAALPLLDERYLSRAEIVAEATRLKADPFGEIRTHAYAVLRRFEAEPAS